MFDISLKSFLRFYRSSFQGGNIFLLNFAEHENTFPSIPTFDCRSSIVWTSLSS